MDMFTALSSPTRREIIKTALMNGTISREDGFGASKLKKSTVYEHFRHLLEAGLLEKSEHDNRKFVIPKAHTTMLKMLLFPKSNVNYLDLNMSTWRILEHQSQYVSIVDEILTTLKKGDPVYNATTIYGLIRLYKHEKETGYHSNMHEKGLNQKLLAPITPANVYQANHMSEIMEVRHLPIENLGFRVALQGHRNTFVWFMEQDDNLTLEKEELVLWLNGSIFRDAYATAFDYFWRQSIPYEIRAKELNIL